MPERRLSRRDFLKLGALSAVGAASLGAGSYAYAGEIEPDRIEIVPVRLALPRLAPAFDGYRLVQISDLHADGPEARERLAEAVRLVNGQNPDLICVTGDFATSYGLTPAKLKSLSSDLIPILRRLRARDGVVTVLGNHDHWAGPAEIRQMLTGSGITDLSNDFRTLRRGSSELHVAGVDDVLEGLDRLDRVLERMPLSGPAILLAHEPDFADTSAATGRFGLQLSGHSHGGQVRLPLLGPPLLPPLAEKYPAGRYRIRSMTQYTNRGVGMLPPRVRLACRPEITTLTLRSPNPDDPT